MRELDQVQHSNWVWLIGKVVRILGLHVHSGQCGLPKGGCVRPNDRVPFVGASSGPTPSERTIFTESIEITDERDNKIWRGNVGCLRRQIALSFTEVRHFPIASAKTACDG
jgi:hypothetical protein